MSVLTKNFINHNSYSSVNFNQMLGYAKDLFISIFKESLLERISNRQNPQRKVFKTKASLQRQNHQILSIIIEMFNFRGSQVLSSRQMKNVCQNSQNPDCFGLLSRTLQYQNLVYQLAIEQQNNSQITLNMRKMNGSPALNLIQLYKQFHAHRNIYFTLSMQFFSFQWHSRQFRTQCRQNSAFQAKIYFIV